MISLNMFLVLILDKNYGILITEKYGLNTALIMLKEQ